MAGSDGDLQGMVEAILHRHPAVGLAFGVVRDGGLEFFQGHGVADIETREPVAADTIFRIASITKTFTAIAVMQLWERGLIDLDATANDYLRAFRLITADPSFRQPTVRHLLTHTAGLPEVAHLRGIARPDFGESVPAGSTLPSLAEFYGGALRVGADPGTRFVYGNHSFATLGQIVEDVSGTPLHGYLKQHVFEPLGMDDTDLLRSPNVEARLATGYTLGSRGPRAVKERDMVTAGAASIYSTPNDMARYLATLLGGGANRHGRVLQPDTLATMFDAHHLPDPRLAGFGLGFYRSDLAGHREVEHHGVHPGFDSHIGVAPDDGVAVMALTNGAQRAMLWLGAESSELLRHLIGVPGDRIRTDVPHRPEVWADIRGWYRLDAGMTDVRLRGSMGVGAEVLIRSGRPVLRFLSPTLFRGLPLHPDDPDDPDLFRVDLSEFGGGTFRVAFSRDGARGRVAAMHIDLMPLTLEKQPDSTNPRRRLGAGLGVGVAGVAAMTARRRFRRT